MTLQEDRNDEDRAPLSAYLNNSTIRGVVLIGLGLFALAAPDASHFLLGLSVAIALVTFGATDIRSALRSRPRHWIGVLIGTLYIVGAAALVVRTDQTIALIAFVVGAVLIARGLLAAYAAIQVRDTDSSWTYKMTRGFLWAAVGMIVLIVPDAIVGAVIFAIAGAAIIAGSVSLSVGIAVAHDVDVNPDIETMSFLKAWFRRRDVGDTMRATVVDNLFFEGPGHVQKQVGFWVLLVLSTAIATLGIMADSTAVVIGAMLVAPLMTPIMGVSVAIVNGWPRRVSLSFATVAGGVAVSIAVAWILAAWVPQLVPIEANAQIQSRISPTLIDLLIAVAAGAAGAYATIDKRVSSSITGVAIAVALVPPLGVAGIMLKAGEFGDAGGALLLFLTNLVAIILTASVVFVVGGLVPFDQFKSNRAKTRTTVVTVALAALVITVPLFFTSEGIIASASRQSSVQSVTEDWLADSEGISLERVVVNVDDISIVMSGEGDLPSVAELEASLEEELGTDIFLDIEYFPSVRITSDDL
ncbi:MAG: TIGR00341 family protein [Actinomycetia bacterium]|nr:TIGR00341 family protein [Actinomycetes bacterium]